MCIEQIISSGKDMIVAGAAAVGAVVAVRGLSTWNRQLKGSVEYDLARRVLKITYRLRDAIKSVRHPMMWAEEMPMPPKDEAEKMSRDELSYYGSSRAYQTRWQKVADVRTDLQAELLEAEVLWGSDLEKRFEVFNKLEKELFIAIRDDLTLRNPKESEAMKQAVQRRRAIARDVMYDDLSETGDDFTKELLQAILPIEDFLKPHLRR